MGAIPKKRTKTKSQSSYQTSTPLTPSQILMQSRANMESTPTKRIRQNAHRRSKFDEIDLENEMSPNTRHLLEIRRELNHQGDVLSNIVREANTYNEVNTI